MTATVENETSTGTGIGRVARIIGPVVDVEFGVDDLPEIYNALTVEVDFGGASAEDIEGDVKHTLTLEVAQHIGDNLARDLDAAD
jgi:F-type H+-transporting ATPase subunit beta